MELSPSTEEQSRPHEVAAGYFVIAMIALQAMLVLLGLALNIIIIVLFCRKSGKTSANYFPYSLAIADILLITSAFIRFTLPMLVRVHFDHQSDMVVKAELYGRILYVPAVPISVWMVVAALAERYITLHRPFSRETANNIAEKTATRVFLITIVTFELLTVIFFVHWYLVTAETQATTWYRFGVTYAVILGVYPLFGYIIPTLVILILLTKLSVQDPAPVQEAVPLQSLGGTGEGTDTGERLPLPNKASTKAIKIISLMVFMLLPWLFMHYAQYLDPHFLDNVVLLIIWTAEYTLIMIFGSVKCLVYRFCWPDFKTQFLQPVCCHETMA